MNDKGSMSFLGLLVLAVFAGICWKGYKSYQQHASTNRPSPKFFNHSKEIDRNFRNYLEGSFDGKNKKKGSDILNHYYSDAKD